MSGYRPSVLMVDDVEANLVALEALLGSLDCELVRAHSGNEALKHLLRRDFAVMLLDVQMPEMDGYEVARLARENPDTREVPIIFITAMHESEDSMLRGYGSGAVDFLFKPMNPHVVRSKVQVFLELFQGRQRLTEEIAAHQRTLSELESFNYSVSHDLRAPLRPLDGFSQVLLEEYGDKLDERGQDYLRRIRSNAQRMAQLIDDLLRLARIRQADFRRGKVSLSAVAEGIAAELRRNEPTRAAELVVAPNLEVEGDEGLLRIALENLMRNAWKFSRHSTPSRIEVFAAQVADETVYTVRDNGVGFDAHYAAKLFKPFQRLHNNADFEGTGIGLAIVDKIIQHHGGRIWAESEPGKGAAFSFTLQPKPLFRRGA
jgi:signal transduction histidine kinase